MRILIITLHTIENEFDRCRQSIDSLEHDGIEHLVFSGLSKKEAHNRLYETFMSRSSEFDLFMKLDADMIIEDGKIIGVIETAFARDPELDLLLIPVYDHFVNRELGGVNVYRNTVRWAMNKGHLFTDRSHLRETIRRRKTLDSRGKTWISHCKDPGNFQAFHFGFHRIAKALQKDQKIAIRRKRNWKALRDVLTNFYLSGERRHAWAVLGAEKAFISPVGESDVSYDNTALYDEFLRLEQKLTSESDLRRAVSNCWFARLRRIPCLADYYVGFYYFRCKRIFRSTGLNQMKETNAHTNTS